MRLSDVGIESPFAGEKDRSGAEGALPGGWSVIVGFHDVFEPPSSILGRLAATQVEELESVLGVAQGRLMLHLFATPILKQMAGHVKVRRDGIEGSVPTPFRPRSDETIPAKVDRKAGKKQHRVMVFRHGLTREILEATCIVHFGSLIPITIRGIEWTHFRGFIQRRSVAVVPDRVLAVRLPVPPYQVMPRTSIYEAFPKAIPVVATAFG